MRDQQRGHSSGVLPLEPVLISAHGLLRCRVCRGKTLQDVGRGAGGLLLPGVHAAGGGSTTAGRSCRAQRVSLDHIVAAGVPPELVAKS
jgi:hypothetical protein